MNLSCVFYVCDVRYNYEKTYNIVLGANQVVPGMEAGLLGMCVGERRNIVVPPHLGYGEEGVGEFHTQSSHCVESCISNLSFGD